MDSVEFAEGLSYWDDRQASLRKGENYGRNKAEIILDKDQLYILSDKTVPHRFCQKYPVEFSGIWCIRLV